MASQVTGALNIPVLFAHSENIAGMQIEIVLRNLKYISRA
jgi:hypothetical protein